MNDFQIFVTENYRLESMYRLCCYVFVYGTVTGHFLGSSSAFKLNFIKNTFLYEFTASEFINFSLAETFSIRVKRKMI